MAQTTQVGTHKTTIYTDKDGFTHVKYHHTVVVSFSPDKIILNTGGFYTLTTKNRMNQASYQFNLNYHVFQKDFDWFVGYKDKVLRFYDRMIMERG